MKRSRLEITPQMATEPVTLNVIIRERNVQEKGDQISLLRNALHLIQEESQGRFKCPRKQLKRRSRECDGQFCGKIERDETVKRSKSEITFKHTT